MRMNGKKMFIKPWNEEAENILRRLSTYGRARTHNVQLARDFSKRSEIRQLSNQGLFSISNNRRNKESWFNIPEDVFVSPRNTKKGIGFEFKRIQF